MIQLIYVSRSLTVRGASIQVLHDILRSSKKNNGAAGLTGFLVADGRRFYQVLEGEPTVVERTLGRIKADKRHTDIIVLARRNILTRKFGEWLMGSWMCTPETLSIFVQCGFHPDDDLKQIDAGMVLNLAAELSARLRSPADAVLL